MNTYYYFLPFLRTGLAATLRQNPADGKERATLDITLTVDAIKKDGGHEEKSVSKTVQLYGPWDVSSFNKQIIIDHDPADDVGDFEPNYFPTVQFRDPDFPWRYNAGIADGINLLPWLSLVVLVAEDHGEVTREFTEPEKTTSALKAEKRQLPFIENVNTANLPDLQQAWRWAHVQVTSSCEMQSLDDEGLNAYILDLMRGYPGRLTSRLVCTRRLRPGILYDAFLVPTFKLGLAAAGLLSSKEGIGPLDLAWETDSQETLSLPYYYRWEFRTGERGDFELLVRRLKARELTGVGLRDMDCSDPGLDVPCVDRDTTDPKKSGVLEAEGAVQSLDAIPTFWGRDRGESFPEPEVMQQALAKLVNQNTDNLIRKVIQIPDAEASFAITDAFVDVGGRSTLISCKTSVAAVLRARYGRGELRQSVYTDQGEVHSFQIEDLDPGSSYLLRIEATAEGGQRVETMIVEFITQDDIPLVLPPIYGRWHAGRSRVDPSPSQGNWLDELNLDPRHRAASGVGAEVVRRHQEALMASAWEQVGEVDKANAMLNQTKLAKEVSGNYFRRLEELPVEDYFCHTRLLHHRVKETLSGTSVDKVVETSRIPKAALNHSLRRLRRPYGSIRKRQMRAKGERDLLKDRNLLERFNGQQDSTSDQLFTAAGRAVKPIGTVDMLQVFEKFDQNIAAQPASMFFSSTVPTMATAAGVQAAVGNISGVNLEALVVEGTISGGTNEKVADCLSPMLEGVFKIQEEVVAPPHHLDLNSLRSRLSVKLDPRHTLNQRMRDRLQIAGLEEGDEMPDIIMAAPEFSQPMYDSLQEISQEWLIPGIENIPQNTISLLKPNQRFIESFLLGCCHEFAAELLWREYPTDQRGTYFRQFWNAIPSPNKFKEVRDALDALVDFARLSSGIEKEKRIESELKERGALEELKDITPIHGWMSNRLGENADEPIVLGEENLVLIVRGDLLRKYPNAVIYAVEGVEVLLFGQVVVKPGLDEFLEGMDVESKDPIFPIFSASLPPDITLLGFDIRVSNVINSEWFFVIEERVSETRFGLDVPSGQILSSQDELKRDLAWDHFLGNEENPFGKYLDDLHPNVNVDVANALEQWIGQGSASIAGITFQKPVRIVVSSDKMIPKELRDRY
jgi:hypothetical protein